MHRACHPDPGCHARRVVDNDVRGAQPITLGAGDETEGFALPVSTYEIPNQTDIDA